MKVLINAMESREYDEARYNIPGMHPETAFRINHEMPRPPHERPILPHERRPTMSIEFDDSDWEVFQSIYEDEDEAAAAMRAIMRGPSEIHVLAYQHMCQIKLLASLIAKDNLVHNDFDQVPAEEKTAELYTPFKFAAPGMDEKAVDLYSKLYGGADGTRFLKMLSIVPDEIPVLSRLIAYENAMIISFLNETKGDK